MKVALYQNNPVFGEIEDNINKVIETVEKEDYDLLVLPELFATGYQFKDRTEVAKFADPAGEGRTYNIMKKLADRKCAIVVYGYPEIKEDKLFNSALAITPEGGFYNYQKTHLFDSEKLVFDPGESGFIVFEYNMVKIGMMVCFDWRFPESARKLAFNGAQIICHPSNLVLPFCPDAMITRALENNVFTITADRIGSEDRTGDKLTFIGKSRIIAPNGKILGELGTDETRFLAVEIDPKDADNKRINSRNDLFGDLRPELY